MRAELLPALSSGSAHAPAHRYFDVPSGLSLHRSGEQVARFGLCVLGARKTEKNLPRAKAQRAPSFGEIKVGAAKKKRLGGGAFASLAS